MRIFLRFGATGDPIIPGRLPANSLVLANLLGINLEGAVDELLIVNLGAAGNVDVFAAGDEV